MSNKEGSKKQLETIQNQLILTHKEILQTRVDVLNAQKSMLEAQIASMKNDLAAFNANMKLSQNRMELQMKQSNADLYWSIFLSAMIGVVGNYFVTLWYQPQTQANLFGLIGAGFSLVLLLAMLIYWMFRSQQSIKVRQKPL
jgi:hypothetical protein